MASSISSGRANSGSKGFDFGSDDILCSYEDYGSQEASNGRQSDQALQKSRAGRGSVYPANSYGGEPEESFNQEAVAAIDRSIKKHMDSVVRFLEGMSSRLSQLELYCYNLDKLIGEVRNDVATTHGETDSKLVSLDKHLQEVHRSVQILRDKQELADTQKELAKLQLVQKASSSSSSPKQSTSSEEKAVAAASDSQKADNPPETLNQQQLALALPPMPPLHPQPLAQPQAQSYFIQPPHSQYMHPSAQTQQFPQYQQAWSQQSQVPHQPSPTVRAASTVFTPYGSPDQQTMAPQGPPARADLGSYGYGSARLVLQQQSSPQDVKATTYGMQTGDGYVTPGPTPVLPSGGGAYVMYDNDGGRAHHHPPQQAHFVQGGGYGPASANPVSQNPQSGMGAAMAVARNPSHMQARNHPYGELVEKMVTMGFRGDHVVSVIQRIEDSGQPVDFNTVLDRLSSPATSASSQRGW